MLFRSRGEVDVVYLAYTRFINTMKQEPVIEQLLPLSADKLEGSSREYSWDYLYEPDAQSVLDELLVRYVEAMVYQAVAENIAGLTGIVNHDVIPGVVYTFPEFAGVGLTEEAAKEKGEIKVGKFPMLANSRAKTNHEPDGFVKVISDEIGRAHV